MHKTRQAWDRLRNSVDPLAHHRAAHHTHDLAYCAYYAFALFEDHGIKFIIVSVIFAVTVLATLAHGE